MNAVVANNANLVGITGIARRLVQDGAMDEAAARAAMAAAAEAKVPLAQWVNDKKLVSAPQMAAANAIEFGIPLLDVTVFDPAHSALKLVSEDLLQKHQVLPCITYRSQLLPQSHFHCHFLTKIRHLPTSYPLVGIRLTVIA